MKKTLACEIHDTIEIVCLYGYEIQLTLKNQSIINGRAKTTETTADKKEWIEFVVDGRSEQIELIEIKSMQAKTTNRYFDLVHFS